MSTLPLTWIVESLIASTLLMAAVLILRRPTARLLGPHAAYLLWALPALRLLLPPIPGANFAGASLIETRDFVRAMAVQPLPPFDKGMEAAAPGPSFHWAFALLVLWLSLAAIHMIWHVVRYRRFINGVVEAQACVHVLDGIRVYNADIAGPAAAGIVSRRIFLPNDFTNRFDPSERRLALAHEIAHHRRGDLVANWVALAVLSLHWFNPLAHIAYRAFRADQEMACDATVLGAASATERHAYASAVVKAAWVGSPVAACPMNSAGQLKSRLAMMKAGSGGVLRRRIGFVAVAVMATMALGATASGTAAALPDAGQTPSAPITKAMAGASFALKSVARRGDDPKTASLKKAFEGAEARTTATILESLRFVSPSLVEPADEPAVVSFEAGRVAQSPAPVLIAAVSLANEGVQPVAVTPAPALAGPSLAPQGIADSRDPKPIAANAPKAPVVLPAPRVPEAQPQPSNRAASRRRPRPVIDNTCRAGQSTCMPSYYERKTEIELEEARYRAELRRLDGTERSQ